MSNQPIHSELAVRAEGWAKVFFAYIERLTLLAVLYAVAAASKWDWIVVVLALAGLALLFLPAVAQLVRFVMIAASNRSRAESVAQFGFWMSLGIGAVWAANQYIISIVQLIARAASD